VLGGCGVGEKIGYDEEYAKADRDPDSASSPATWTLVYYLAADNEQEAYAQATIDQLVAATAKVENHPQVIVLIDRLSVPGTEVFEIAGGAVVPLESYPEQVTSSGAVLKDFATYALELAAHDNVAFVIKSEGFSWRGIGRDNTHDPESPDTLMSTGELNDALVAAQAATGKSVEILVLEGSIMAFIEVVHELRGAAPILLASQSKIQPAGIPWSLVIDDLGGSPEMGGEELAVAIVDDHFAFYSDKGNNGDPGADTSINFAAMTAFDMTHVGDLVDAHVQWAGVLYPLFDEVYNLLPHARDLSEVGGYGGVTDADFQFDMRTFMVEGLRLIEEAGKSFPELNAAVDTYLAVQDQLILHEQHPLKLHSANGLSIWYPPTWNQYDTRDGSEESFGSTMYYEDPAIGLDWVTDSNWVTYLLEYFDRADANLAGNGPGGDEPPKKGVID
jgi:hypothetical protein